MGIARKNIKNESSIPIGMIAMFWLQPDKCPDGWVICDGRQYIDINGYTQTAPNLIDLYPRFSNADIGQGVAAGLPPFDGTFNFSGGAHTHANSYKTQGWGTVDGSPRGRRVLNESLNAATSGGDHTHTVSVTFPTTSVYGKSTTVTPPSVRLLVCMRIR